jgi:DNA polymerase IV (DinB-like DNA polymerase)
MPHRIIGHLDMDAFFAAIEERDNPRWRGLPLVVGADPRGGQGRGVVSTANYAARVYGIRSALPIRTAWQLSEAAAARGLPRAIFLPGNWRRYNQTSQRIMSVLQSFVPLVQQRSVDEAYFDLSFANSSREAQEICQDIKKEIWKQEQLTTSIGIGPNKLVAKIACNVDKPNGLMLIREEEAEHFLEDLPLRAMPGIGPKTELFLQRRGMRWIRDIKRLSRVDLERLFGKWGGQLYTKVRGQDDSSLTEKNVAKSISKQITLPQDTLNARILIEQLLTVSTEVFQNFKSDGFQQFRTVTVTVRFADFETISSAHTGPVAFRTKKNLQIEALKLFLPFLDHRRNAAGKPVRLVGVRVEKLT